METKKQLCSDPYSDDHQTLARAAAVKKWRGLTEGASLASGTLFTPDYLSAEDAAAWGDKRDTSKA